VKIAIIGSGISGLGAAYLLGPAHDVVLFESDTRIGGHARTIDVQVPEGLLPVDTGFIVLNDRNYPYLHALFKELDVDLLDSDMSFGVSIDHGRIEYSSTSLFAQRRNIMRLEFWRMLADILRFNAQAVRLVDTNPDLTLGQAIARLGLGQWFRHYYLLAMGAAIWSTPLLEIEKFPAKNFITFFNNHGLLSLRNRPRWQTVKGGSRIYLSQWRKKFRGTLKTQTAVTQITNDPQSNRLQVSDEHGGTEIFDHVIFACSAPKAATILRKNWPQHDAALSNFRTQENQIFVHSDINFMPKRRSCWASWVYLSDERQHDNSRGVALTYWMNALQKLPTQTPVLVTLNPVTAPAPELTYDRHVFHHPVYDFPALRGRKAISEIQGHSNIWFCGAWLHNGFHEDGLRSAVEVATKLGVHSPWG
jgi:predicted NAD/FAD-binding protein